MNTATYINTLIVPTEFFPGAILLLTRYGESLEILKKFMLKEKSTKIFMEEIYLCTKNVLWVTFVLVMHAFMGHVMIIMKIKEFMLRVKFIKIFMAAICLLRTKRFPQMLV